MQYDDPFQAVVHLPAVSATVSRMTPSTTYARQGTGLLAVVLLVAGCASQPRLAEPPVPPTNPDTDLIVTRTIDAPPERIWAAWTESDLVGQWWGPTGFTCPLAEMNVCEGGTSLVCMRAPDEFGGRDYYNTWTYTTVIAPQRLDFIARFTDENGNPQEPSALGLPPGIPAQVPHVLLFKPLEGGRTELTIIEYRYGSQEAINLSRMGMEQCLEKLAQVVER